MRSTGWLFLLACVVIGTACKFPYPADVPDEHDASVDGPEAPVERTVGGAVTGLWIGGAVTLRLSAGAVSDDVTAGPTEPFVFDARLADGADYVVTVLEDGPDHDCSVINGSGRVTGEDVDDLSVDCTNLIPHAVGISTPVPFPFDPRVTRYEVPVSVLQQETRVIVTGASLTGATVADQAVVLSQASPPVALGPGQTTIAVTVTKGTLSQRYDLVFDRGAAQVTESTRARAGNPDPSDRFGGALVIVDDQAIVAATGESGSLAEGGSDNNTLFAGAVYAFRRGGAAWNQSQVYRGTPVSGSRGFGEALALEGNTLVVGATEPGAFGSSGDGSAYVFQYQPATQRWTQQQLLRASDRHSGDAFGSAVAISGDRLVIGAPGHDGGSAQDTRVGMVYVFRWDGTRWVEETRIRQANPQSNDEFGRRLAFDGETVVVTRRNAVDVYRRAGTVWSREAQFAGYSAAIEGDLIAIGQPGEASGNGQPGDQSAPGSGAVRVYSRTGATWTETAYLKASPPQANAQLGTAVALHRNVIVAGAPGTRSLHIFHRIGGSWVAVAPVMGSESSQAYGFGESVALTATDLGAGAWGDPGPAGTLAESGTAWFFR